MAARLRLLLVDGNAITRRETTTLLESTHQGKWDGV